MRLRTAKKGHNGGIFPQTAPPWPVYTCVTIILTKSHNNLNALDHSITLIGQFVILAVHVATLIVTRLVAEMRALIAVRKNTSTIVSILRFLTTLAWVRYLVDTKHNDLLNQALQLAPEDHKLHRLDIDWSFDCFFFGLGCALFFQIAQVFDQFSLQIASWQSFTFHSKYPLFWEGAPQEGTTKRHLSHTGRQTQGSKFNISWVGGKISIHSLSFMPIIEMVSIDHQFSKSKKREHVLKTRLIFLDVSEFVTS